MQEMERRLTTLEEKTKAIGECMVERRRQSDAILEKLDAIQTELNRLKGFSAGVAMSFSIIGAVVSLAWQKLSP